MMESDESNMPPFIGLARPLSEITPQKPDWDAASEVMRDGGQFIPYPASWLRAERWDDVLTIELPKPVRKPDRYELANIEQAKREAEWRARQAIKQAAGV